jgi:prevent-host-death family protein
MAWQIQQAKNRFSELIDRARHEGPQIVTRHGQPVAEVVAIGATSVAASSGAVPAQRTAAGRGDGFATYLLEVPRVGVLEAPPRKSRKSPVMLGE